MFPSNNPTNRFRLGSLPQEGRLTTPVGTYYSNPATAASGVLGAGDGFFNVAKESFASFQPDKIHNFTPQLPGVNPVNPNASPFSTLGVFQTSKYEGMYFNRDGGQVQPGISNPVVYDSTGQRQEWNTAQGKYIRSTTGAFNAPTAAEANPLVGTDTGAAPMTTGIDAMRSVFPGRTDAEINQIMMGMGYTAHLVNGKIVSFLRTSKADQLQQQPGQGSTPGGAYGVDERGRPLWLSSSEAASLAPGQTVDTKGGVFRGGTATTQDIGSTPKGTSQYAVTVKQHINKKLEKEGAYKWVSYTRKDENGNWVKVWRKELRATYQEGWQERHNYESKLRAQKEAQQQAAATAAAAAAEPEGRNFNQLVTLRVSYG